MPERRGIIAIGNLLVDQSLCCSEYPQESMLTQISDISRSCGGGCTNVLFDLARLDPTLPLALAGFIGPDDHGEFIVAQARQHRIDTSRVQVSGREATSFTYVMVNSHNGRRTFFHHMGANLRLGPANFDQLDCHARIAHVAYLLLLPGLEQEDEAWQTTGARALASLQEQGFEVSLDLVSVPEPTRFQRWVRPVLPQVDHLIINDEEARLLCQDAAAEDTMRQAHCLLEQGVRKLVCVHDPRGAVAVDRHGKACRVDAYHVDPQDVVSTLGAGDAFCAGMLYGIHENWPLEDALHLGCASARFNLFSLSASGGACDLDTLEAFIRQESMIDAPKLRERRE